MMRRKFPRTAIRFARPGALRLMGTLSCALALAFTGAAPLAAQPTDEAYTAKIREYTTEPFFLTPYVDRLPASSRVPTPLAFLGRVVGTPRHLHYPEEIHRYMRAVADASPRIRVLSLGESEEGREQILVVASHERTLAELERHKAGLRSLADPRTTNAREAERLIRSIKPVYHVTGAIHSPETGSPEMLMELVYRLAVEDSPHMRAIRDSLIVIITPIVEVDGRAKQVDLHMARHRNPETGLPTRPLYWGKYVAHSNNRDGLGLSLNLTRNILRTFLEWRPLVLHDLHESAAYLYVSTGRGPYNAWVDPMLIGEWNRLAFREVTDLTGLGVPGVYTYDFYDGWNPNYMFWIANMRNSIGRFYETQTARDGSTRVIRQDVDRQWHRPNTPLKEVRWSLRNNVNLQQSALIIALHEVALNRSEFLRNFHLKSQRSVAKARAEGPAAYVFPADDPRPGQQARLLRLLQRQGIEVHRLGASVTVDGVGFPAESYVVRMDQPFSRAADMLLDRQYYSPADPRPYDDVGWTLGPLYNVRTMRVENPAILDARLTRVVDSVQAPGGLARRGAEASVRAYAIDYRAENHLAAFRFRYPQLVIESAPAGFEEAGRSFAPGSLVLRTGGGNPSDLEAVLERAGRELGFVAHPLPDTPRTDLRPITVPRIAVLHTWHITQNEGWLRIGLDEYGIPYDYISVQDVRRTPQLRDRYDVILFGPSVNDPAAIVRGLTGDRPIPWERSEETPNIGRQASTPDMRGGLDLEGVVHLRNFVRAGGVLVTIGNTSALPVHFDFAPGLSITQTSRLWAPGGVFRVEAGEERSPLLFGYDDTLSVYFNTAPVFSRPPVQAARSTAGQRAGSTTDRRSSRGGILDSDIVQGRPRDLGQEGVAAFRVEHGGDLDEVPATAAAQPKAVHRTLLQFAPDVTKLLVSGGLDGGAELAGTPALVDVPLGEGRVILFAFNPFWRGITLGSYGIVFNALLHHGHLGATLPASPRSEGTGSREQ